MWEKGEGQGQTGVMGERGQRRWGDMAEMRGGWGQLKGKQDTEVTALEQGPWKTRPHPPPRTEWGPRALQAPIRVLSRLKISSRTRHKYGSPPQQGPCLSPGGQTSPLQGSQTLWTAARAPASASISGATPRQCPDGEGRGPLMVPEPVPRPPRPGASTAHCDSETLPHRIGLGPKAWIPLGAVGPGGGC